MRVITGKARGHKLAAPEGIDTRPTSDRIKESLFNIIAPNLEGSTFLDLFSGSGAIGIEALSRGAGEAVFVEASGNCVQYIESNLKATKLFEGAIIINRDAIEALWLLNEKQFKFDIIFMDPPYKTSLAFEALLEISKSGILKKEGFIVVECPGCIKLSVPEGFRIIKEKTYGKTTVLLFLMLGELKC